jgi:L-serine dehydratase
MPSGRLHWGAAVVVSVFDLFKIGIGPSSSHTVGPMWAAHRFLLALEARHVLDKVERVEAQLYGSLALTGQGHATDKAILLGLAGEVPDRVDPDEAEALVQTIRERGSLRLMGRREIAFAEARDLQFRQFETMTKHPNGMRFIATGAGGAVVFEEVYFSVGGGFVLSDAETDRPADEGRNVLPPYPFGTADELLAIGDRTGLTIAQIVLANETAFCDANEIEAGLDQLWQAMEASIERGCQKTGELPGGLHVRRRAARLHQELCARPEAALKDQLTVLDWVNLYALAVNEENAAGGRVVTAPTNGAAGVIPAVLAYYDRFVPGASAAGIRTFLLTAAAIGQLYEENASISAAEVGCQGEVGVACSMAAGALCAVMGGTNRQV